MVSEKDFCFMNTGEELITDAHGIRMQRAVMSGLEDDGDVFEITDFTTASEWERFIARVEEIIHEWKLVNCVPKPPAVKAAFTSGVWEQETEELSFAKVKFHLTHHWLKTKDDKLEKSAERESCDDDNSDDEKEVTTTVFGDLMSFENDFPFRAHCISRWYGLQDFMTLALAENTDAICGTSKIKLLLSSVHIALTDAECAIPVFVQVHQQSRKLYQGTAVLPGCNVEFGMIHLNQAPKQHNHMSGLLEVFRSKLAPVLEPSLSITVSIRFQYILSEWVNTPFSQPLPEYSEEVGCNGFDQLPFGACEDPINSLTLCCTWPCVSELVIVDNQVYSDLNPQRAPLWSVRILMTEDPQCLLGEYLISFLALCHRKETLQQLFGSMDKDLTKSDSGSDISSALQKLTEPAVSYNLHVRSISSYVGQPLKQNTGKDKNAPLQTELLDQVFQFLFPDAAKPITIQKTCEIGDKDDMIDNSVVKDLSKQLKSAQVNGLLYKLAICLCILNKNQGGVLAVAQMWQEFLLEMRYRWENNFFIVGVEKGPPNLGSCILQQKLQMLNCCIEHKKKREQLHKGYTANMESPLTFPSQNPVSSRMSSSLSDEDVISQFANSASSDKSSEFESDFYSSQTDSSSPQRKIKSSSLKRSGKMFHGSLSKYNSGDSSDEEFFECNEAENQSDEKDVDTMQACASEEQVIVECENQSESEEVECTTVPETHPTYKAALENGFEAKENTMNTSQGNSQIDLLSEDTAITHSQTVDSLLNVSMHSDSVFKESYSYIPEGRLAPFQDFKLVNCDDRMYIPITQDPAPMTEDMLEEHAEILAKLGTSPKGAELRARMQSACLLSDMESFKAANPGCVLEDFVRWYSPRDWIEEIVEDENGQKKTEGHLSPRMLLPGNMWVEVWQTARPVPAKRQKRLFDDTKEAEKVLHFLSSLKPGEVVVHLMPMLIHAALLKLTQNDDPKIPVLQQMFEQAVSKTSQVTRCPTQDAKRYEELVRIIIQGEIMIARTQSLKNKFISDMSEQVEVKDELESFVTNILQNPEVAVRGGADGPVGLVISTLFQAAQKASCMIPEEEHDESTSNKEERQAISIANFPQPTAREYIFRTVVPRPAPYSKTLPQRMFCSIEDDEFRIAGAFASDSVFQ